RASELPHGSRGSAAGAEARCRGGSRFFRASAGIVRDFPELFQRAPKNKRPSRQARGCLTYGEWNHVIRVVAGHDYERAHAVSNWPIREGLLAYVHLLRKDAIAHHRHEELVWAALDPHRK